MSLGTEENEGAAGGSAVCSCISRLRADGDVSVATKADAGDVTGGD